MIPYILCSIFDTLNTKDLSDIPMSSKRLKKSIVDIEGSPDTLWLFNIAMENGPFIDDFPIKASIYKGFSMAMLNNHMVFIYIYTYHEYS